MLRYGLYALFLVRNGEQFDLRFSKDFCDVFMFAAFIVIHIATKTILQLKFKALSRFSFVLEQKFRINTAVVASLLFKGQQNSATDCTSLQNYNNREVKHLKN